MRSSRSSGGVVVGSAAAKKVGKGADQTVPRVPSDAAEAMQPPPSFGDFDPQSMEKIIPFVADRDAATIEAIKLSLTQVGVRHIHAHPTLDPLAKLMESISPDLIILGGDVAPTVFDFIRDIRHNKIGTNPFVLVTTLIAADHFDAVKKAMQAGTDDIIVKPVKTEQLLQRLKRVTVNRQAFVVTSDYLGPDRRAK